ncbi:LADA_0C01420g1_1 [Lachancea dasiensis]|uniref:LADA_0C01420g1_1 n=1 Tax=Lachancea dasiensis TaxID=1072105 RepID=A0A1G4IXJ2_9SACH|nr:LADA_0C01420g1_1 [Lachancea dasiensis]
MSRPPRRGKGIKDENQEDELAHEPSRILSSVLKTLDLTFERDIGLLNGKHVRSLPGLPPLQNLQGLLNKLETTLERISASDRATIATIKEILENAPQAAVAAATAAVPGENSQLGSSRPPEPVSEAGQSDDETGVVPVRPATRKRSLKMEDEDEEEVMIRPPAKKATPAAPPAEQGGSPEKKTQSEIDRIESDPSVKNPKSEFVGSQTLPAAAVTLGLFTNEGLESTGEEFLKKKYGVSSYPASDLKDLLPGEIPDMDFSRPKPANQIQYTTFLTSVDNFFRELNEDDIKFLKNRYLVPPNVSVERSYDPEVTPYVIPKLGPTYIDAWAKEDNNQNIANLSPPPLQDPSSILPKKSSSDLNDDALETDEISCGPLVSRLLSAIMKDETKDENELDSLGDNESKTHTPSLGNSALTPSSEIDDEKSAKGQSSNFLPQQQEWKANSVNLDYPTFEERLKRELKYVGIYMNLPKDEDSNYGEDPDWLTGREDDEISAELRELQSELRQVTKRNIKRKSILVPLVERRLAWQEYASILDDLDKQTDQAYVKRIRAPKNKKKKQQAVASGANSTSQAAIQAAHQQAASSSLKSLLDKRRRWVSKIGPLFDRPEVMKRMPKESVFRDLDQEEDDDDADVFGSNGNGKDDELTDSLQSKDE